MPAAAVIPAPVAYIKVVAVEKLVVGFLRRKRGPHLVRVSGLPTHLPVKRYCALLRGAAIWTFTLRKLECLRQANALNILAWNNNIGPWGYFIGF